MGIYDRDYGRYDEESPYDSHGRQGVQLGGPRSLTTNLILLMVGIYAIQILTRGAGGGGWFTNTFSLHADVWRQPWMFFQLLTYGFLHDPNNIWHILFNAIVFWFFGRVIEMRYGRREFLAFFLAAVVFAGTVWCVGENFMSDGGRRAIMLGASGGIAAVLLLFVLNFPHQVIYIWGVLPIPSWAFALLFVGQDIFGAVSRSGDVAYTAHLGGALFAFLYFRYRWRLSDRIPTGFSMPRLRRRPNLKVHHPDATKENRLDDILRKIQDQGQESLTREERRFLERTSHEYQQKRS